GADRLRNRNSNSNASAAANTTATTQVATRALSAVGRSRRFWATDRTNTGTSASRATSSNVDRERTDRDTARPIATWWLSAPDRPPPGPGSTTGLYPMLKSRTSGPDPDNRLAATVARTRAVRARAVTAS